MSNVRIETSLRGFMEYNPDRDFPETDTFISDQMLTDVVNYWGNPSTEKMFTIPFWKAEELIANSNLQQLALKVTNIDDPSIVRADWLSFHAETTQPVNNSTNRLTAKDTTRRIMLIVSSFLGESTDTESYFAFGNDLMDKFRIAIRDSGNSPVTETVNARIGRNFDGDVLVYFFLGKVVLHLDPGVAGSTASCGVRIPPGQ